MNDFWNGMAALNRGEVSKVHIPSQNGHTLLITKSQTP